MHAHPIHNNNNNGSILFCRKSKNFSWGFSSEKKQSQFDSNPQKLFLYSKICNFPIFDMIPKQFTVSTKHGSSRFNIEMLKDISSVISDFTNKNPNENTYFLNINDEENVLNKFEQLFLGQTVIFDEDDLPSSQRITKMLKIKNCPNYLKPESLRIDEVDIYGYPISMKKNDLSTGVVINPDFFVAFLSQPKFQTFTIKTNNKQYQCNIFGIYSSDVIRQIIEKDPTTNEFSLNIDDEFDDFQLICDLFSFKQIDITNNNMDFLKEMAEELQIKCVIKQLDDYINKYQKITEKIDEQQTIIDSIDHLFDLLFNIQRHGIEKVKISIVQSKWSKSEENIQELAAFILQSITPNYYLHKDIADLIILLDKESNSSNKLGILVPFLIEKLMTIFIEQTPMKQQQQTKNLPKNFVLTKSSSNQDKKFVLLFIRVLYKKGIISKDEIIEKLDSYNFSNKCINAFFLPEIFKINPKIISIPKYENNNNKTGMASNFIKRGNEINFNNFIKNYLPDKIDLYEQMLDKMEPDDELTKSLQRDDVDTLQSIITSNEIDIPSALVPYNIFDDLDENPSILNYAALYGSLKCFKYLLLNNGNIDDSTLYFAVYGGNTEIIKIVDQRWSNESNEDSVKFKFKFSGQSPKFELGELLISKNINNFSILCADKSNNNSIISSTIKMHRNELFDWIFENRFVSKGKIGMELNNIALISASSGNAHSLIEVIDKGYDISNLNAILNASKNGFCKLTQLLLHIIDQKAPSSNNKSNFEQTNDSLALNSVIFGNLSIFKLLMKLMNQSIINNAILNAIKLNYKKIVEFYFNNLDEDNKRILKTNNEFINMALIESLKTKDDEWFNFLIDKFKNINQSLFNRPSLILSLLSNSCSLSNLMTTKTITEMVLSQNPNINFSQAFILASSSGAMDICQYFIDKKVYINYEQLASQVSQLGSVDEKIFSMIFNNVNESTKEKFWNCINQAIKRKNKKLIEFLLKMKKPIDLELFDAVSTHDLEIVDLVLKYNSEPSFINQKIEDGTALHIATKNNDIEIVKRLLSIPGIDPSLISNHRESVLIIAIKNQCFENVSKIIDFYRNDDNNNQSNEWLFYDCLNFLSNTVFHSNNQELIWKMIQNIFEIKSIDPNYYDNSTFLYKACQSNKIEIVESLLKLEKIDVNKYEFKQYYTPLMIAVENNYLDIVKLLINHPKINLNLRNINNDSALIIATKNNNIDIINILVNNEKFDPIESRLSYAFIYSNNETSEYLLPIKSLNINQSFSIIFKPTQKMIGKKDEFIRKDMTLLTYSVEINDIKKIDQIINHPSFDKDKSDINEAIFIAAKMNNIEIFKKLLSLINNDLNIRSQFNKSLLVVAASKQSETIIDYLFNNPSYDFEKEDFPVAFVSSYCGSIKQHQQQKKKLQPNFPLDVKNKELLPDKSSRVEIMEKILNYDKEHNHSIDLNKLYSNGKSVFTNIYENYDEIGDVVEFLINNGADPTIYDLENNFSLTNAIRLCSLNFVIALYNSNKIDFNEKLLNGNTYLHFAAGNGNADIIKFLIDKKIIDINVINDDGETPLMLACRNSKVENINCLFSYDNIDYLHCNNNGIDALKIVKVLPNDEYNEAKQTKESYRLKLTRLISIPKSQGFTFRKFNS